MATLFPDNVLKKTEEDISSCESKGHSNSSSHKKGRYSLMIDRLEKSQDSSKSDKLAWKTSGSHCHGKKHKGKSCNYSS